MSKNGAGRLDTAIWEDDTEPWAELLCAILLRAVKDAHSRNAANRAAALAWLESGGADCVCEWLDIQPGRLRSLAWRGRKTACGKFSTSG